MWLSNNLESFPKPLKALEEPAAREGLLLSESPLSALQKAREEKQASGEIQTQHPGYLGAQDTYYGGTIKAVAGCSSRPSLLPTPK
ncbi:MAG: hypothetical protein ICV84_03305 [Flavisolibacter sp.]|nr:hypothetical protein [Flavisolibacter sp.]